MAFKLCHVSTAPVWQGSLNALAPRTAQASARKMNLRAQMGIVLVIASGAMDITTATTPVMRRTAVCIQCLVYKHGSIDPGFIVKFINMNL